MCNVVTLPDGNPLDVMKGRKIVAVVTSQPLSFKLDDGKILKLEVEKVTMADLDGKPTLWLNVSLDERLLFRKNCD